MFRSTTRGLRDWWADFSEDILGADLPPSVYDEDLEEDLAPAPTLAHHLHHAHRQPLKPRRIYRDGMVPARPAHCLSPIRSDSRRAPGHQVAK